MAARFTVTLTTFGQPAVTRSARVLASCDDDARARAVRRWYGRRAFWQPGGITRQHGQVFSDVTRSGESFSATSRTDRGRCDVAAGW